MKNRLVYMLGVLVVLALIIPIAYRGEIPTFRSPSAAKVDEPSAKAVDLVKGIVERHFEGEGVETVTMLSEEYSMSELYMSMLGPWSMERGVPLLDLSEPEKVWVTGIDVKMVDGESLEVVSPEFFCHSNLSVSSAQSDALKAAGVSMSVASQSDVRMFTLVPGRMSIQLPAGFGIPMASDQELNYDSMVLNLNVVDRTVDVRVKTRIKYVRDSERKQPIVPLSLKALYALEPTTEQTLAMLETEGPDGPVCSTCGPHRGLTATTAGTREQKMKGYTIHWMVPPGRYTYITPLEEQVDASFDTRVHYATAHLHPFGESIEIQDVATGEAVLRFESKDFKKRLGVSFMDEDRFEEGLLLEQDHEYELVTVYNNTSENTVDAMSIVYLYVNDSEEGKSKLAQASF